MPSKEKLSDKPLRPFGADPAKYFGVLIDLESLMYERIRERKQKLRGDVVVNAQSAQEGNEPPLSRVVNLLATEVESEAVQTEIAALLGMVLLSLHSSLHRADKDLLEFRIATKKNVIARAAKAREAKKADSNFLDQTIRTLGFARLQKNKSLSANAVAADIAPTLERILIEAKKDGYRGRILKHDAVAKRLRKMMEHRTAIQPSDKSRTVS